MLLNALILSVLLISTPPAPTVVIVPVPSEAWSLRTGTAIDKHYNCDLTEITGDIEFPGDCPDTSMGDSE